MQAENVKRIPYAEKAPVEAFRSGANPPVPAVMSSRARERPSAAGFRFTRQEISGSLGDLGTFLPARDLTRREDALVGLLTAGLILAVNVTIGFLIGMLFRVRFNGKNPEGDLA